MTPFNIRNNFELIGTGTAPVGRRRTGVGAWGSVQAVRLLRFPDTGASGEAGARVRFFLDRARHHREILNERILVKRI